MGGSSIDSSAEHYVGFDGGLCYVLKWKNEQSKLINIGLKENYDVQTKLTS